MITIVHAPVIRIFGYTLEPAGRLPLGESEEESWAGLMSRAQSITFGSKRAPLLPPTPTGGAICLQSIAQSLDDIRMLRLQVPSLTRIRLEVEQLNSR